jgi:hypothetical protein
MLCAGTHHDLSQCKEQQGETLRSYTWHFFNTSATIANISDEDVNNYFQNSFTVLHLYRNFGRNRPKTMVELRNMMQ